MYKFVLKQSVNSWGNVPRDAATILEAARLGVEGRRDANPLMLRKIYVSELEISFLKKITEIP